MIYWESHAECYFGSMRLGKVVGGNAEMLIATAERLQCHDLLACTTLSTLRFVYGAICKIYDNSQRHVADVLIAYGRLLPKEVV